MVSQVPGSASTDEFFHFVLLCFAIGSLLVCYHYYAGEWRYGWLGGMCPIGMSYGGLALMMGMSCGHIRRRNMPWGRVCPVDGACHQGAGPWKGRAHRLTFSAFLPCRLVHVSWRWPAHLCLSRDCRHLLRAR